MNPEPNEYLIKKEEFDEVVEFIHFWTTAFRNGCSEKERLRLSHVEKTLGAVSSRPSTAPARFPNSTQLIEMAHTDWKNREERKHNHDEQDWCAGWINGYLTPNKPSPAPSPNLLYQNVIANADKIRAEAREEYETQLREKLYQLSVGESTLGRELSLTMGDVDDAIESLRSTEQTKEHL
jgi:hypothetical protein